MEQKKNVMQNICSQTAALFEMRFYCDACQSTIWEMNRSVISSEIVSACGCLSLCACSPVHVSNTFFFGNAGGDLGAVNCYDLTSHENDVELLMIASQKGNSSPVQFSEMNKHESLIQLSLFTCYCWSCSQFVFVMEFMFYSKWLVCTTLLCCRYRVLPCVTVWYILFFLPIVRFHRLNNVFIVHIYI